MHIARAPLNEPGPAERMRDESRTKGPPWRFEAGRALESEAVLRRTNQRLPIRNKASEDKSGSRETGQGPVVQIRIPQLHDGSGSRRTNQGPARRISALLDEAGAERSRARQYEPGLHNTNQHLAAQLRDRWTHQDRTGRIRASQVETGSRATIQIRALQDEAGPEEQTRASMDEQRPCKTNQGAAGRIRSSQDEFRAP